MLRALLLSSVIIGATPALACPMADAAAFAAAAEKITAALTAAPGVRAVAVDHQTGRAEIAYDRKVTAAETLMEKVRSLGYQVSLPRSG